MSGEIFFSLYKDDLSDVFKNNYSYSLDQYGNLQRTGKLCVRKDVIDDIFNTAQWGYVRDGRLKNQFVDSYAGYYFLTKYEQRDGDNQPARCQDPNASSERDVLHCSRMHQRSRICS